MPWQIITNLEFPSIEILEFLENLEFLDEKSIAKNLANLQRTFIAHNAKTNEYFAARALFCHKGIYYFFDGQEFDGKKFKISKDKNELLKGIKKELDLSALSEYLSFMSAKKSFFKSVFELRAGEYLCYKNGKLKKGIFDSLKGVGILDCDEKNLEFLKSRILATLEKQISLYHSQNPCALLSGGLDSSLLTALFARQSKQKVQAFNLAFLDAPHYDESEFARATADFIGCKLHSVNLGKKDFLDTFYASDFNAEPLADSASIALRFLCEKIASHGHSVAFSAEGADECFLGYDLYFRVLEFYRYDLPQARYPLISKDSEYLRRKALGLPIYGGFCEVFTRYQKELLFEIGRASCRERV